MSPDYLETREKVPDGHCVHCWPELHALLQRLGVPKSTRFDGVELYVPEGDTILTFTAGTERTEINTGINGWDVFRWLEYRALRDRLGVPYYVYEIDCRMRFAEGELPTITQTYAPAQPKAEEQVRPTAVIDTSTAHNKKFRTHATP